MRTGICYEHETRLFGFTRGLEFGSHVDFGNKSNFKDSLCCSSDYGNLHCELHDEGTVPPDMVVVASLDRDMNSHIGEPHSDEHNNRVGCRIE